MAFLVCTQQRPTEGADAEPLSAYDSSCDQCLRTIYDGSLTSVDGRLLCRRCVPESATFDEWMAWAGMQR